MKFLIILFLASSTFIYTSCIKEINPRLRNALPELVVEGSISTDSTLYNIRITYSGQIELINQIPDELLEKNASVSIHCSNGDSTLLRYIGNGYYETTDSLFIGLVGLSYWAEIILANGKKYVSVPEKMNEIVPVDSINVSFIPDFNLEHPAYFRAFVNTSDPVNQENYYKWEFYSYTRRQTYGVLCGGQCVKWEFCLQKISENELNLFSDASVNGNSILGQGIGNSYIYTYGVQYFNVTQVSITRNAFQFWNSYKEQTTRTGDLLDPLPAAIRGNIVNSDDPADYALGYFSTRALYNKKLVINPFHITEYLLIISANSFIHPEYVACFEHFPNSLSYGSPPADPVPPPPGWENADTLKVVFTL